MNKKLKATMRHWLRNGPMPALVVVGILVVAGLVYTAINFAATGLVTADAENGEVLYGAVKASDSTASGGQSVRFTTPSFIPPIPAPVSTTPNPEAGFIIDCDVVKQAKDDPIVYPGGFGASHMHTFTGSTIVDANATAQKMARAGTSSCAASGNTSSYWMPTLLTQSGALLKPTMFRLYYLNALNHYSQMAEIPFGLRMISGYPDATSPQNVDKIGWRCRNIAGDAHRTKLPTVHACPNDQYMQAYVIFPECWDGRRLDSPDHRSHMAYAPCPATHPIKIPQIRLEAMFPIGSTYVGQRMENVTPHGLHADTFSAWDPATSRVMYNVCTRANKNCGPTEENYIAVKGKFPIPNID
jgi:hypothetical protein